MYRVLLLDKNKLESIDNKNQYIIKQKSTFPEVFISYSSKDQTIADLVVDALDNKGVNSWIASKKYCRRILCKTNYVGNK